MMIAFRHRHRKLEVIKSSLTVSFAPIRFPPPSAVSSSRSLRSFVRKRLHLIPDSVQFPSTPLPLSLPYIPLSLCECSFRRRLLEFMDMAFNPTNWWTIVYSSSPPNGATTQQRRRRKRGMPGEFGGQVARILRCWSRKSGPRSSCPWIVSRIAMDGIRTPDRTRLPPRAIRGSAAPPSAASVANEAINNRQ